jgi:hypothetical protein
MVQSSKSSLTKLFIGYGKTWSPKKCYNCPWVNQGHAELILTRYVTGGIGAMQQWEGFGIDYFLPQGTDEGGCYCETCAAIGVMMLAQRLLQVRTILNHRFCVDLALY